MQISDIYRTDMHMLKHRRQKMYFGVFYYSGFHWSWSSMCVRVVREREFKHSARIRFAQKICILKSSTSSLSLCFNLGFHRKYACHICNDWKRWFSKMIVSSTGEKKIHFKSLHRNIINICRLGSHAVKSETKKNSCLKCKKLNTLLNNEITMV